MNLNHIHQQNSIRQFLNSLNSLIPIYIVVCVNICIFFLLLYYMAEILPLGCDMAEILPIQCKTLLKQLNLCTVHHNPPESLLGQLVQSVPQALPKEQQHVALE